MRILPFLTIAAAVTAVAGTSPSDPRKALSLLPAWFEPAPDNTRFTSHITSMPVSIDASGAVLGGKLRMSLAGGQPKARLEGVQRQAATSTYFVGRQRDKWRADVPHFDRVAVRGAYPGIDVLYYAQDKRLEYDFLVQPGSDPKAIRLRFSGIKPKLAASGELELSAGIRQHAPVAYQMRDGQRVPVASSYEIARNGEVGFRLGAYDRKLPLVIDPVVSWSGYVVGNTSDIINAVVADPAGGFWVAGSALAQVDIPEDTNPYYLTNSGLQDIFLAKIVPDGTAWKLVYWSYIGGTANDEANGLTWFGNRLAMTGSTASTDFPLSGNAFQLELGDPNPDNEDADDDEVAGGIDAFVFVYDPSAGGLDTLTYSTYYGGTGTDVGQAIAAGPNGMLAITGYTNSGVLYGATEGVALQPSNRGGQDTFVAVLRPFADTVPGTLIMSTFLGGNSTDVANSIGFDSKGMVYVAGTTLSNDFPLAGASYQSTAKAGGNVFFTKLDPTKTAFDSLLYSTYIGGRGIDSGQAMVIDSQDRAWIAGYTTSNDLPVTPGAYQLSLAGGVDAFLLAVDPSKTGAAIIPYCTYFGDTGTDIAYGLAQSPKDGSFTLGGYTTSANFPQKNIDGYTKPPVRLVESWAARIDPTKFDASALVWSLTFGGNLNDVVTTIAVDAQGSAFLAGFSNSNNLPVSSGQVKPTDAATDTGFFFLVK
ncbi:DUF7948 domain-containing protein [Paludibaculum fermentans]|uniref:SBBP repeat-containing protein n=1 Tax=Paludibaculum fermentans TaxID=1473598 RepID=A0A7S7SM39_PALFE|nr:SBBP repeat-containing protein [Paludibaculum fermentans]QOY89106.1 SBBP repeat-containing protein [Paludibaculum fermentans]